MTIARTRPIALAAILAAATIGLLSQPAAAQEKVWKHGLLNAKADAGIFLMVSTRDFAASISGIHWRRSPPIGLGAQQPGAIRICCSVEPARHVVCLNGRACDIRPLA